MDKLVRPGRLVFLAAVTAAIIVVYIVALYKLQIVEGEAYYEESRNNIVTTETVPAARGGIMDRYGRVLVTNRACNNLMINVQELFYERTNDESNAIILQLCNMVTEYGDTYTDELPITDGAPFEFTDMTDIQRARLTAWEAANSLDSNATAVEVMAAMRSRYKIDDNYTSAETRIIAGVRYEVNVRYIINTSDYIFAEDVSMDLITRLMENNIPGFRVETSYVREYETDCAAQLLGYVGMMDDAEYDKYSKEGYNLNAKVGKDGAEYAFENYLHGTDGEARLTSTATGVVTDTTYTTEPQPGDNVYLTIDSGLQKAAENALDTFITEQNSERQASNEQLEAYGGAADDYKQMITGGAAVVVNVKTGEPLAIASWPTYDPATFMDDYEKLLDEENDPLFDRALLGTYAPGSTFKPCVAIAGLSEGKIDLNTTITCEGIFTKYEDAGYAPKCWIYGKGTHGTINVTQALTVSCNYFFYTVGDYLQISLMAKYAKLFGLGESTGVELPENVGVMASDEYMQKKEGRDMYAGDTLQAAIGQSDSLFSPLQIAEYCAAIADGGTRHTASILKSVRSFDFAETVYERDPEVLSSVDTKAEYFKAVQEGMYGVANDAVNGTVYSIFSDAPYKVAAKTGTAQTGSNVTNNGVFMCYAPYDDPEIAVAIVIEKGGAGSSTAGVARSIMDYYFAFKNSTGAIESEDQLLK